MQIFKICSARLQPLAPISFIPSVIQIRVSVTEKKQFKKKLTDNDSPSWLTSSADILPQQS